MHRCQSQLQACCPLTQFALQQQVVLAIAVSCRTVHEWALSSRLGKPDDVIFAVTEPTLSGLHDAKRVIEVAEHFKIPVKMVVNKYDLNNEMTGCIERFCEGKGIAVIGKIGFDRAVVESMVAGTTIVEHCSGRIREEIMNIWQKLTV